MLPFLENIKNPRITSLHIPICPLVKLKDSDMLSVKWTEDLDSMSSRSRLRLGTRNIVSMMLHSVCLIADDDGENNAVRSHVLSSNLSGTAWGPPAETTS